MEFVKNLSIDKIRNAAEDAINQARPKSEVEARVFEVLSHKNWGSSSTLLNEIARDTFDYEKFGPIIKLLWDSLENQRPAAWRVVFKGLTLLEHLIKNGSERCVDDGRNHSHVLRSLFNFNYYEGTVDRGVGVREKSKQLVEILGDDERIREERTKAKQLREKFGGNLRGVSGGRSDSGGYEGYGQDNYSSGGGGYGESGIGSTGRSSSSFAESNAGGYSGRYSDSNQSSGISSTPAPITEVSESSVPTFAAIPEKKKKTKKTKTKKKKTLAQPPVAAPAEPKVDLFAFDDPPPKETEPAVFDAFGQNNSAPQPVSQEFDAFGQNNSAPQPVNQDPTFDAFASSAPAPAPQPVFDAFSNSNTVSNQMSGNANMMTAMPDMFGKMNMGNSNDMMGMQQQQMGMQQQQMGMQQQQMGMQQLMNNSSSFDGASNPGSNQVPKATSAESDDFGDFEDANKAKSTGTVNPMSKLISLDGLSKNKKVEDKLSAPVLFNEAAKVSVDNNPTGVNSAISSEIAFAGVDGLNKMPTSLASNSAGNNRSMGQPIMNVQGNNGMMGMGGTPQQGQMGMNNGMNSNNMMAGNNNMMGMGNMTQQGMGMNMNTNMGQQGGNAMGNMGMVQQNGNMTGHISNNMAANNNFAGGMSSMGQQSGNMGNMNSMGMNQQVGNMMGGGMNQQGGNMMAGNMGMNQQSGNMMGNMANQQGSNMTGNMNVMGMNKQGGNFVGGQAMGSN